MRICKIYILILFPFLLHAQHVSFPIPPGPDTNTRLVFVGQLHYNKANNLVEQQLLLHLHENFRVRYELLEYAHSMAFLLNAYLDTGDTSYLKLINNQAGFAFIKSLKRLNDGLPRDQGIRFYGLDFENRAGGNYTRAAVKIIAKNLALSRTDTLQVLLSSIMGSGTDLEQHLNNLKTFLSGHDSEARSKLGKYFLDLLLITNSQFDFSPDRDDAMYANFGRLYSELKRTEPDPGFFASFGTGHVNPANKKGIASRLMNEATSPVHNKVAVYGVQYFNCSFRETGIKRTAGNLDFGCSNKNIQSFFDPTKKDESIIFLNRQMISELGCRADIKKLSGIFLIYNFPAITYYPWE